MTYRALDRNDEYYVISTERSEWRDLNFIIRRRFLDYANASLEMTYRALDRNDEYYVISTERSEWRDHERFLGYARNDIK